MTGRTLSPAAIASMNAQETEEVWLVKLSIQHPSINEGVVQIGNTDPAVMSISSLTRTIASPWVTLADTSSTVNGYLADGGSATPGDTYTVEYRVQKDAVGRATRFVAAGIYTSNGGTSTGLVELALDTATGETHLTNNAAGIALEYGAIAGADEYLLYISITCPPGANLISHAFFPAYGAGAAWGSPDVSVTGSAAITAPVRFYNAAFMGGDPTAIRVVNDMQDMLSKGELFVSCPFEIQLPGEDQDQASVARIRVDNVDRKIVQAVRDLPGPPKCSIEVVLASQPDTVEVGFYDLTMRAVTYDALTVESELTMEDIVLEPICASMTPERFPSLF